MQCIGFYVILTVCNVIHAMDSSASPSPDLDTLCKDIHRHASRSTCSTADLSKRIQSAIEMGTPIDGKALTDQLNFVPLLYAAQLKDPTLVEWLLAHGASRTISNIFFESPFHALLDFSYGESNCEQSLSTLIAFYKDILPLSQEAIIIEQLSGNKPLVIAAHNNNALLARRCLEYGLNPNAQDERGRTALMLAVENKAYAVMRVLLEYGVDVTISDLDGRKAIDYVKRGMNGSLKKQLVTAPAFEHTKTFLQYQPATAESVEFSLQLSELWEQRDIDPPVPAQMIAAIKLNKTKPERPKRVAKRTSAIDSEEKPEIYYRNKEEDFPAEQISITGFNRPDLLFQPKKHKTKKKS